MRIRVRRVLDRPRYRLTSSASSAAERQPTEITVITGDIRGLVEYTPSGPAAAAADAPADVIREASPCTRESEAESRSSKKWIEFSSTRGETRSGIP